MPQGINALQSLVYFKGALQQSLIPCATPERASHLVLYGGYLRERSHRGSKDVLIQEEAMISLIPSGWGQNNPAFRQIFTSLFVHDGTTKQMDWFNELQRRTQKSINVMG